DMSGRPRLVTPVVCDCTRSGPTHGTNRATARTPAGPSHTPRTNVALMELHESEKPTKYELPDRTARLTDSHFAVRACAVRLRRNSARGTRRTACRLARAAPARRAT